MLTAQDHNFRAKQIIKLERGAPSFSGGGLELPAPTGDTSAIAGKDQVGEAGSAAAAKGHRPRAGRGRGRQPAAAACRCRVPLAAAGMGMGVLAAAGMRGGVWNSVAGGD